MFSVSSDTLLWKKGFSALVDFSATEIVHLESENIMTQDGCMELSAFKAFTTVRADLDMSTVLDSSLLGIV